MALWCMCSPGNYDLNEPKNGYRPKRTPIIRKPMNGPTSTPTPIGPWKVLSIIAQRLPPNQLIWLAAIVCLLMLGLAWIASIGLGQAVESKPAAALTNYITAHVSTKKDNVP